MVYQSKTTVVTITVTNWTEASDVDSTARFDASKLGQITAKIWVKLRKSA